MPRQGFHIYDHWGNYGSSSAPPGFDRSSSFPKQEVNPGSRLYKLNPPPKFDPKALESWIRQMIFWRQLYSTIEDVHILPTMGLHMTEEIKELLMDFLEDAEDCPGRRGFAAFLEK